jgi:hypothetical protein
LVVVTDKSKASVVVMDKSKASVVEMDKSKASVDWQFVAMDKCKMMVEPFGN